MSANISRESPYKVFLHAINPLMHSLSMIIYVQ
jgi:hypothetical protein